MTDKPVPEAVRMCIASNLNRCQIKEELREHSLPEVLAKIQKRVEGGFFSTRLQISPIMAELLRDEKFDVKYIFEKAEGIPIYLIRWDHPRWKCDGTDPKAERLKEETKDDYI